MTTQTGAAFSAAPSNPYLSGIWWNREWVTSGNANGAVTITWASNPKFQINAAERAAINQIFSDISKICNITFVEGNAGTADLLMSAGTYAQMQTEYGNSVPANILGIADPPGTHFNGTDEQSWVFANRTGYSVNGLNKGGYDYIIWLHEIGHALGLAHPHDAGGGSTIYPGVFSNSSLGTDNLNQGIYTTMSYNAGWSPYNASTPKQFGWQATMMAFDVAALQLKYGANMSHATGNNYYMLSDAAGVGSFASCIWDAGGTDWIYYAGAGRAVIDLRPATLTTGYGAGGFISYVGGNPYRLFTIANGVTIENAAGGQGADTIVGNTANNTLYTYAGNDTIYCLDGNDFVVADAGDDIVVADAGGDIAFGGENNDYLYGGADNDILYGGNGNDGLYGGSGNDALYGGEGGDILYGGDGFDQLSGGSGYDTLYGGGGTDYFNMSYGVVAGVYETIDDFTFGVDYIQLQASLFTEIIFMDTGVEARCFIRLAGGGSYGFGVAGITAAQLQASVFLY